MMLAARLWPTVKWCIMSATEARVSARFARHGVPALLIYRGGQLVGSHVSVCLEIALLSDLRSAISATIQSDRCRKTLFQQYSVNRDTRIYSTSNEDVF